jgi:hypothetical protein
MSCIKRLPTERLANDSNCLIKQERRAQTSVCQKWKESATQPYYEEISLSSSQIHKIKTLIEENLTKEKCLKRLQ